MSRLIERSYAVILAGGSGERFLPLSTGAKPKAFQRLIDSRSLLQATACRARLLLPWGGQDSVLVCPRRRSQDVKRVTREDV